MISKGAVLSNCHQSKDKTPLPNEGEIVKERFALQRTLSIDRRNSRVNILKSRRLSNAVRTATPKSGDHGIITAYHGLLLISLTKPKPCICAYSGTVEC